MSTASLQDVMRDMARKMEKAGQEAPVYRSSVRPANEIEAYIGLDPVLADMYCHFLEAKRQYIDLGKLRGGDDPLTEVARDAMDSADCAVQTRLLELRRDRKMRARITRALTRARHAAYAVETEKRKKRQEEYHSRFLMEQKKQREKEAQESIYILFMAFLFLSQALQYTRRTLSMLHSFSNASYYRRALTVVETAAA